MCIYSLGWVIISALFTYKAGILRDKIARDNKAAIGVMATAGGFGGMGYQEVSK